MIDEQGYRHNVGIVICNDEGKVLWAKRYAMANAWQFPQGGIHEQETPQQAMYRELHEELGLLPDQVDIIAETNDWLSYDLPTQFQRRSSFPLVIGQKQKWFLLRLTVADHQIRLDVAERPEFDAWKWVDFNYAIDHIIDFKRDVYRQVNEEFMQYLSSVE